MNKIRILITGLVICALLACNNVNISKSSQSDDSANSVADRSVEQHIQDDAMINPQDYREDKNSSDEIQVAKVGNQIELYVGGSYIDLKTVFSNEYSDFVIDDTSIATISDGKIVPQNVGFTFISAYGTTGLVHKNIIVYDGLLQIDSIEVDGVKKDFLNAEVGKKYKLSVNNVYNIFSNIKIRISTNYGSEVQASDFVLINNQGEMDIVGVGEFDITVSSKTNRLDKGKTLHVKSDISDSTVKAAISKYFLSNGYDLSVALGFTQSELAVVEELTFDNCFVVDATCQSFLPNLKLIRYDFSTSQTTLSALNLGNDKYDYEFIGNENKTYSFSLSSDIRNTLNLKFINFNFKASTTPLDLSNIGIANIIFSGKSSIISNDVGADKNGIVTVKANILNIQLLKDANITIKGGNGGSGTVSSTNPQKRDGGEGICVTDALSISAVGYSSLTSLEIYGGNGGNGSGSGNGGGNGATSVSAHTISIDGMANYIFCGGNGGNGVRGAQGTQPEARSKAPNGSKPDEKGSDGATGQTGGSGQAGGRGGDAGSGIVATDSTFNRGTILIKTGSGGAGGEGGTGGTGGTGGVGGTGGGGYKFPWWYDGDGGNGGNGGIGGTGGDGGDGGDVPYALKTNKLTLREYVSLSLELGKPGAGGNGGNGGTGGKGGQGGNASTGNADSATNGSGGYGGKGGDGGKGGNAGKVANATNIEISKDVAVHNNGKITTAAMGGNGGAGGFGGNHGNNDYNGTDRSRTQADSGKKGDSGSLN